MTTKLGQRFLIATLWATGLVATGCSSSTDSTPPQAPDASEATHRTTVQIAFNAGQDGTIALSDIQGPASVKTADVVGRTVAAIALEGGEQPGNAQPLAQSAATIGPDLKATLELPAVFRDGPYEIAINIIMKAGPPPNPPGPPAAEDLVAFSDPRTARPKAGDPALTGQTVRYRIEGKNATVALDGSHFIRFGTSGGSAQ